MWTLPGASVARGSREMQQRSWILWLSGLAKRLRRALGPWEDPAGMATGTLAPLCPLLLSLLCMVSTCPQRCPAASFRDLEGLSHPHGFCLEIFSGCPYFLSTYPSVWHHRELGSISLCTFSLPGSLPPSCTHRSPFSLDTFHLIILPHSSCWGFVHLLRLIQDLTCPNSTMPGKPNCRWTSGS